ncbi:MAG: hypothetical protein M3280_00300 [Actinomycetota bacterium]|nr:hypothetical protein [Actinomycetota bacterium]
MIHFRLLLVALVAGAVAPAALTTEALCATENGSAVLVVDTGGREYELCVELNDDEVSGIELVQLAHQQHGLDYQLGYGGQAVCQLANIPEPNPPEECFEQGEPFWGYWRDQGSGWQWSGTGAGSTLVSEGDVEGWAFGEGNNGDSHPTPPSADYEEVCPAATRSGGPGGESGQKDSPGPTSDAGSPGEPASDPGPSRAHRAEDGGGERGHALKTEGGAGGSGRHRLDSAPEPSEFGDSLDQPASPASSLPASATSSAERDEGFPLAGILAVMVTLAMGAAAAFLLLRSRSG